MTFFFLCLLARMTGQRINVDNAVVVVVVVVAEEQERQRKLEL